jgi:hypothetical protein
VPIFALAALVTVGGCKPSGRLDSNGTSQDPAATITGTVRGVEDSKTVGGRVIEAINVATNERLRARTNEAGAFILRVKPGKYRVELALKVGERLSQHPGVMEIRPSASDAHADFVIRTSPNTRPRGPAYRTDHGLGAPIA